jgi:hypothetical protein
MANCHGSSGNAEKEVMGLMGAFLKWEMTLFMGVFALIIFYQILSGEINTSGLLEEKDGKGELSWGRVQLLLFTFIFAFIYLFQVIDHPSQFPDIPQEWLVLLGGSNLAYLGEKTYNLAFRGLPRLK